MALIDFVAPANLLAPVVPVTAAPAVAAATTPSVATPPPVAVTTTPVTRPRPTAATGASPGGAWACIRAKESGGNYAANTGNGYYGAYQFSESTWRGIGGTGYPNQAPPAVQDAMAQKLQQRSGWGQWSTHSLCGV